MHSFFILKWWFIFFLLQQYFIYPRQRTFKLIHNNILFSRFFPRYIFLLIPFRYYKQNLLFTPTVGITSWFIFIKYSTNRFCSTTLHVCKRVGIYEQGGNEHFENWVRYRTILKIFVLFSIYLLNNPFPLKTWNPVTNDTYARTVQASGDSGTLFWPTTWIISYPEPK